LAYFLIVTGSAAIGELDWRLCVASIACFF
jgi:hypothetical protein